METSPVAHCCIEEEKKQSERVCASVSNHVFLYEMDYVEWWFWSVEQAPMMQKRVVCC